MQHYALEHIILVAACFPQEGNPNNFLLCAIYPRDKIGPMFAASLFGNGPSNRR
jgi:hypothetical protein